MGKNKKILITGFSGLGLFLALSWGVSPSMAASAFQTQTETQSTTRIKRSVKTPAIQPRNIQPATRQNIYRAKSNVVTPKFDKSLMVKPSNAGISKPTTNNQPIPKPGYEERGIIIVGGKGKINPAEPVGKSGKINLEQAVGLNPQFVQPKESSGIRQNIEKAVGLNPQPLPSKLFIKDKLIKDKFNHPTGPDSKFEPADGVKLNTTTTPIAVKNFTKNFLGQLKAKDNDSTVEYGGVNPQAQAGFGGWGGGYGTAPSDPNWDKGGGYGGRWSSNGWWMYQDPNGQITGYVPPGPGRVPGSTPAAPPGDPNASKTQYPPSQTPGGQAVTVGACVLYPASCVPILWGMGEGLF